MKAIPFPEQEDSRSFSPVPPGFYPEGVDLTSFDNDLLYLVEHAIPPSIGGLRIFSHLLGYATLDPESSMQRSLFQTTEKFSDALVLIRSIETLARTDTSPCAPETYHKVLLALEAMQIIRRKFHRTYTEISVPLEKRNIHIPTLLAGLQHMYREYGNEKGTNKFQKFAVRVAQRLGSNEFARFEKSCDDVCMDQSLAEVLFQLLKEHNVQDVHVSDVNEACKRIALIMQSRRISVQSGKSGRQTGHGHEDVVRGSEFMHLHGESIGDTSADQETDTSVLSEPVMTKSLKVASGKKRQRRQIRPHPFKKGELETNFPADSPEFTENCTGLEQLGESAALLSLSDPLSTKKLLYSKEMMLNDTRMVNSPDYKDPRPIEAIRHEAADLAERLDGSRDSRWFALFVKTIQDYPPPVRRLAEIDTLYHSVYPDYRGKPERPGAVFRKRCEEYADSQCEVIGPIRQWNESGLSLHSIALALQSEQALSPPTIPVSSSVGVQPASVSLQERGETAAQKRQDCCAVQHFRSAKQECQEKTTLSVLNTRMDREQAHVLCLQIRQEVLAFCTLISQRGVDVRIQAYLCPGSRDGEFVVITEWEEDGGKAANEWINAAKWNYYFAQVKKCYLDDVGRVEGDGC